VVIPANLLLHSQAFVKFEEVRATTKQNVLTVIQGFAGSGMFIRGGATTQIGTFFEQRDVKAALGKGASGCQTR